MKFSEIHQVNLNPTKGTEIQKSRLVIIVGDDAAFKNLKLRLIVPIRHYEEKFLKSQFFTVLKPNSENGLTKTSMVDCLQIRSVSIERFEGFLGTVDDENMMKIRAAIAGSLRMRL